MSKIKIGALIGVLVIVIAVIIGQQLYQRHHSGKHHSGEHSSGMHHSGKHHSGEHSSGKQDSGKYHSGEHSSGKHDSGKYHSGEHASGFRNKPRSSGKSTFGTLSQVAKMIERKKIAWVQVDMDALWEHLKDMDALMTHTNVAKQDLPNGLLMFVTGGENAARAMREMIPAHAAFLLTARPKWTISVEEIESGYSIQVVSDDAAEVVRIKALGFSGFMVQGNHHASHHLNIASGKSANTH